MDRPTAQLQHWRHLAPFDLESGETLPELEVAYETWGPAPEEAERVVVVLHALSGSSHAFSAPVHAERGSAHAEPGWWDGLIAKDSPLAPNRCHIICANIVGGCYGTTGPSSIDPRTGARYGARFPQITLADMVQAQRLLLRALGVKRPLTLVGGSMGGMLALLWGRDHPEDVENVIAVAAPWRSDAFTIGIRHVQREAILRDPDWRDGNYYDQTFPARGVALARELGMLTYRSPLEFDQRFGREARDDRLHFREGLFEVQSYLLHQGRKFVQRFDANTYLYYSRAMDLYDLTAGRVSLTAALAPLRARTLLLPIDSDLLCPPISIAPIADALRAHDRTVELRLLKSSHGHDGFLIETEQIIAAMRAFL